MSKLLLVYIIDTNGIMLCSDECGIDIQTEEKDDSSVGRKQTFTNYPWMGSFGIFNSSMGSQHWDHHCGLTLVTNTFALTAAHCIQKSDIKKYAQ